ncbi:N-acetyltransferase [Exilibacterium tricleocarpae]|uniref:N-acetyltransferase n=1 Tax=Exilibacterium tricleocarpae TaxID=2591008 RepID=A0A545SMG4_9GAMM|nr:N-acetyltransferase [Exilibacterium tricleocarpae]TQV66169.1 N-acetyltransferase [Exilibacterium tricleocarpae]
MIRSFKPTDMEAVIDIWLNASIKAHDFVAADFWRSKVAEMREVYIPASETYVYEENGEVKGFASLYEDTLAAIFVAPNAQGGGIGKSLMRKAKDARRKLQLNVYKENVNSVDFYLKCGFKPITEQVDAHTGHIEISMEFAREQAQAATPTD